VISCRHYLSAASNQVLQTEAFKEGSYPGERQRWIKVAGGVAERSATCIANESGNFNFSLCAFTHVNLLASDFDYLP